MAHAMLCAYQHVRPDTTMSQGLLGKQRGVPGCRIRHLLSSVLQIVSLCTTRTEGAKPLVGWVWSALNDSAFVSGSLRNATDISNRLMRRKHELFLAVHRGRVVEDVAVHVMARLYCTGSYIGLSGSLVLALLWSDAVPMRVQDYFPASCCTDAETRFAHVLSVTGSVSAT